MRFIMTIELDNDAFKDGNLPYALSDILNDVACNVRSGRLKKRLLDRSGNTVGQHYVEPSSESRTCDSECDSCRGCSAAFAANDARDARGESESF